MQNADLVFSIANWLVLAGWVMLALSPLRRDALILAARLLVAAVATLYALLLVRGLALGPALPEGAGFGSLDAVMALLSRREAMLGAWVHILAFDLFVGSWIAEDAPRAGVPHWLVLPLLVTTLMAGPLGLLLYLLLGAGFRIARRQGRTSG